jgi:hypothetical protein
MKRFSALLIAIASISARAELIKVPLSFQEALAPTDTTSSTRFQQEYDSAFKTGKTLLDAQLAKCGYELQRSAEFYEASDPLQARERAAKAQKDGAWLVIGPRRSNHYLLTAQGADATPSVSLMANSSEVFALGNLHLTMGISNESIARVLVKTARSQLKTAKFSYITIVNEDCVFCLDSAKLFDAAAKIHNKLGEIRVVSDTPDIEKIKLELGNKKPNVVLLPNYSRSSGLVMAALKDLLPKAVFLGGDGWGMNAFGYVQNGPSLDGVIGFTARGSIPSENALKTFKTGQLLLKKPSAAKQFPESNSALSILKITEGIVNLLCETKPKTRDEFIAAFRQKGSSHLKPTWGVGVYKLENSDIKFFRAESQ